MGSKIRKKAKHQGKKASSPVPGTTSQKDICMAVLLSNPYNFAALFNATHFFKEKILPEDLEERDSHLYAMRFEEIEEIVANGQSLSRDILKDWYGQYTIGLGIENQTTADPAMPVRSLNYDAIGYQKQVKAICDLNNRKWSKRKNKPRFPKDITSGEKLSRFRKTDRIHPLVTAVLFTGDDWDCATDLKEMFEVPEDYLKWMPSWPVNVINPHAMSDDEIMAMESDDMKFFMSMVKYSKDKEAMKRIAMTYFKEFCVSPQICYITGVVLNENWLIDRYKERRNERMESEDMCIALEEMRNDARAEGKAEGREERDTHIILSMLGKGVSAKDIAYLCDIPYEEVEAVRSFLPAELLGHLS